MRATTPNARFWVFESGGWAKLTLRPGESLTHTTGGTTAEGYSCESTTWAHEGDHVRREYATWGRDCDGRHEFNAESVARLDKLAEADLDQFNDPTPPVPAWEEVESGQRDYSAEAAGY